VTQWEWIRLLVTAVLAVTGTLALSLLAPVNAWLGRWARRFVKPLFIHVVANPEQIWASYPDWVSAWAWLPTGVPDPPEVDGPGAFGNWVRQHGGWPAGGSMVEIVVQSKTPATATLLPPIIRSKRLPLPEGRVVSRIAPGGASVSPTRVEVDLGSSGTPESVRFYGGGGRPLTEIVWNIAGAETERVQLQVRAFGERALWAWWAEFLVFADGHEYRETVGSETDPYYVASTGGERDLPTNAI
jgi:hypothetical protein